MTTFEVRCALVENKETGIHAFVVEISDQLAMLAASDESLMSVIIDDVSHCVRNEVKNLFGVKND